MKKLLVTSFLLLGIACHIQAVDLGAALNFANRFDTLKSKSAKLHADFIKALKGDLADANEACLSTPTNLGSFLFTFQQIVTDIDNASKDLGFDLNLTGEKGYINNIPFVTSKGKNAVIALYSSDPKKLSVIGKVQRLKAIADYSKLTSDEREERQTILSLIKQISAGIAAKLKKGADNIKSDTNSIKSTIRKKYLAIAAFFDAISAFSSVCKAQGDDLEEQAAMAAFEREVGQEPLEEQEI